jgi:hypothetical protein
MTTSAFLVIERAVCHCDEQTPAMERRDSRRCAAGEDSDSHPLRFWLRLGRFGDVHRTYFDQYTARSLVVETVCFRSAAL